MPVHVRRTIPMAATLLAAGSALGHHSDAGIDMEAVTTTPARIRVYGDTAIVVGNMAFSVEGMEPGALIYTRAYVKHGDQWQLVTHQSTATPQR